MLAKVSRALPDGWRAANLHPARSEQAALQRFDSITRREWDLTRRRAPAHDVIIAARLGSASSAAWGLQNALHSCSLLVVLDSSELADAQQRLLAQAPVSGGSVRVYRGTFTDPLLRVDDYPTGVRPILDDLTPLHGVLTSIDESGLEFHLGIVPAILEDRMLAFLRNLRNMLVSMHGFEHGYAKYSKVLLDARDPFNQKGTVGAFDEFEKLRFDEISEKLRQGRQILEAKLGRTPASYIPPTNLANRRTGRALAAAGFSYVLSENPVAGCELPCIRSDFYGRSSELRPGSAPRVATLHVTWEADLQRSGDKESLVRFLAMLLEQRQRRRDEAERVAERIASGVRSG